MNTIETLADLLQALEDADQEARKSKDQRDLLMRAVAMKLEPIPGGVQWRGFAFSIEDGEYDVTFPAPNNLPEASKFRIVWPIPEIKEK